MNVIHCRGSDAIFASRSSKSGLDFGQERLTLLVGLLGLALLAWCGHGGPLLSPPVWRRTGWDRAAPACPEAHGWDRDGLAAGVLGGSACGRRSPVRRASDPSARS